MNTLRTISLKLRSLWQRREVKREIDEELRFHLELRTAENITAGMAPEEAAREARRRFGNVQSIREECREVRGASFGEVIWRDIRFGLRSLSKSPCFTAVSVFTLALGIGASTAIFSVVNPLWFNPVPGAEPDRLVQIRSFDKKENRYSVFAGVSPMIVGQLRDHRDCFADLIRFNPMELFWDNAGWIDQIWGYNVSPNFFSPWNIKPWLGRTFTPDEGRPGAPPVIVLSHRFWKNQLGGDPAWIGKPLRFDKQYLTVIGVMPPHFQFPGDANVWVPADNPVMPTADKDRRAYPYDPVNEVIARLPRGVSMKQAQAVLDVLVRRYDSENRKAFKEYFGDPDVFEHRSFRVRPVRETFTDTEVLKTIPGFVGAMIFVLLIACANVANLNLARTEARQHELAIRGALGAGRFQLLRQLLLESLLPALAGAVLGLVLTCWSLGLMEWLLPPELTRLRAIALDWQVLAYSLSMAVAAGLVSGTVPAWYGATRSVATALKQSGVQTTSGVFRNLYRRGLVILEVSLAMVLLAGAGLMIHSVVRMLRINLGFEPTNLIDVLISPGRDSERYQTRVAKNLLLAEVHRRLSAVPGVEAVGILLDAWGKDMYTVTGQMEPMELYWSLSGVGTVDAFKALRAPLLGGRSLDERDLLGTNITAVVVNETLARRCWPGENAVGKTIRPMAKGNQGPAEVVGVVGDTRRLYNETEPILPMMYAPQELLGPHYGGFYHLLVRTRTKPAGLIKTLLSELKAAGPELRKPRVSLVKDHLSEITRAHRAYMWCLAAFGAVGWLLAGAGVYAIMAYSVALRQREIGIRMALGATRPNVMRMVLRQGMILVGIGIGLGIGTACVLTRLLRGMLYGVSPMDPLTLAAGALLLSLIALLACYVPARRAAKVDPMVALRCE